MDALEVEWLNSHLRAVIMSALDKLIASRQKSIAVIESEMVEYAKMADGHVAGSPARLALDSVVAVKRQRLEKLKAELAGFRALAVDSRQAELPKVKR